MKTSAALKMMSLAGALVSLGVFAADDSRTKDMNKGKADASFVEQAAMASVSEIKMSELAVSQSTNTSVRELAQQLIDDHTKAFESLKQIADNKGIMLPFDSVGSSGTTGSPGSMKPGTGGTGSSPSGMGSSPSGTGSGMEGSRGTGSTGSTGSSGTGSSGTDTTGSDRMGSAGSAGEVPPASDPSVSDPAASGERMGAGDRMNTESKNVYGQLSSDAQKKYDDLAKLTGDKFDKKFLGTIIESHKKSIKLFEKESKRGEDSELKSFATNTLPTLKHHLDMAQSVERELKSSKKPSM